MLNLMDIDTAKFISRMVTCVQNWTGNCGICLLCFSSSCNFRLQQCQPCEPIREQNSNPSAIWLDGTVLTLATGCWKDFEKYVGMSLLASFPGHRRALSLYLAAWEENSGRILTYLRSRWRQKASCDCQTGSGWRSGTPPPWRDLVWSVCTAQGRMKLTIELLVYRLYSQLSCSHEDIWTLSISSFKSRLVSHIQLWQEQMISFSAAAMKIMSSHALGWGHELQITSSLSAFISGQISKCRPQIGRTTQAKSITYLLLETVHAPHIHMKGGAQTLAVMAHYGKQPCPLSLTSTCPLLLE